MAHEIWTPADISVKIDSEGGIWDFYMWGGLDQRTGDPHIDAALEDLQDGLTAVESSWRQLQELLPDPWDVDEEDE